jgi:hypothetical protein
MKAKMEKFEQVDRWLDLIARLPLGHPDRMRFLTYAEQIIAGQSLHPQDLPACAPHLHAPRRQE